MRFIKLTTRKAYCENVIGRTKKNCIELYLVSHEPRNPPTGIIRRFGSIEDLRIATLYYNSRRSTRIEEIAERKTMPAECRIYLSVEDTQEFKRKRRLIAIIEKQVLNIQYIPNSEETCSDSEADE